MLNGTQFYKHSHLNTNFFDVFSNHLTMQNPYRIKFKVLPVFTEEVPVFRPRFFEESGQVLKQKQAKNQRKTSHKQRIQDHLMKIRHPSERINTSFTDSDEDVSSSQSDLSATIEETQRSRSRSRSKSSIQAAKYPAAYANLSSIHSKKQKTPKFIRPKLPIPPYLELHPPIVYDNEAISPRDLGQEMNKLRLVANFLHDAPFNSNATYTSQVHQVLTADNFLETHSFKQVQEYINSLLVPIEKRKKITSQPQGEFLFYSQADEWDMEQALKGSLDHQIERLKKLRQKKIQKKVQAS